MIVPKNRNRPLPRHDRIKNSFTFVAALVLFAIATVMPLRSATAAEWPGHAVKIIVPYGPGGLTDTMARLTAAKLTTEFKQSFFIEDRAGGMGTIGTRDAIRSPSDGYTLYFSAGANILAVPLMRKLDYDPVKQLMPVSISGFNAFVLGVPMGFPPRTLAELFSYAKAHPGAVNYGIAQVGTVSQLLPALLAARQGIKLVGIPFNSGPTTLEGLIQNNVQIVFGNPSDLLPAAADHRIRLLAVSSPKRLPQIPDVPTVGETMPGFSFTAWNGYFAPVGTPQAIVDRLSAALVKIGRDPDIVARFSKLGIEPGGTTAQAMADTMNREAPIYRDAVTAAGLLKSTD